MQELLLAVARGLVEDKDAVQVTVDPLREDGTTVYQPISSMKRPSRAKRLSATTTR